jgi:hypothetical protein
VYRAEISEPDDKTRRFRLRLFAELPDRIHGEVVSPLGYTEMVFDGGGGRLAVTMVRDKLAFVGTAREGALEHVFGVPFGLQELVAGLLTGEHASTRGTLQREPIGEPGLPTRLTIVSGRRMLRLELKRFRPLDAMTAEGLGRGDPPAGVEQRPLEALRLYDPPAEGPPEGGAP